MATSNLYTSITVHNDITAIGTVSGNNVTATNTVSGNNVTATNNITATNTVSGNNVTATNTVSGNNVTATNNVTGAALIVGGGDPMNFGKNKVTFNTSWSGPYAAQTVTFTASRFGSLCILEVPGFVFNSSGASNINITGIDVNYRPPDQMGFPLATYNNGTRAFGFLVINTDGTATMYQDLVPLSMFGATGLVGTTYNQSFAYQV